jgi:hypothetical protein
MIYYPIVLVASVVLVTQYVFLTEAAWWSKWFVAALQVLCLAGAFHVLHLGLTGLFLQVGLSVFIALYLICEKARR